MIKLHPEGVILYLYIQPGASRTEVAGEYDGSLKIRVQAPPVEGKANKALVRFIAKTFGLAASRVDLLRGETGRKKQILLKGIPLTEVQTILSGLLGS